MTDSLDNKYARELADLATGDQEGNYYSLIVALQAVPLPGVLHCPACGLQHIDTPEPTQICIWCQDPCALDDPMPAPEPRCSHRPLWENPPHKSHLCAGCGHVWRPFDWPTTGVHAVETKGQKDSPIVHPLRQHKGWALVPIEPTPEMLKAGTDQDWVGAAEGRGGCSIMPNEEIARLIKIDEAHILDDCCTNVGIWPAMLAAAPKPR